MSQSDFFLPMNWTCLFLLRKLSATPPMSVLMVMLQNCFSWAGVSPVDVVTFQLQEIIFYFVKIFKSYCAVPRIVHKAHKL